MEVELNNYMMSPTIDSEMDPLTWWQVHQVDFPHLKKLARKYLCIPANSSPLERLFSTSGNVTCQHTCLKPTKVNMLVFLAKKTGTTEFGPFPARSPPPGQHAYNVLPYTPNTHYVYRASRCKCEIVNLFKARTLCLIVFFY